MSASVEWRRTCVYTVVPAVTPLRIAGSQHPLAAVPHRLRLHPLLRSLPRSLRTQKNRWQLSERTDWELRRPWLCYNGLSYRTSYVAFRFLLTDPYAYRLGVISLFY